MFFKTILFLLVLICTLACSKKAPVIRLSGNTMGTTFHLIYTNHQNKQLIPSQEALLTEINSLLNSINKKMSTYIDSSELSLLNKMKKSGWVEIGPELFKVISYSMEVAKITKGAFDPTIGPLVNLWGFGPHGERKVPTNRKIKEAILKVGYENVSLTKKPFRIKSLVDDIYLDLSSIAKGYAVDEVAKLLEEKSISNYMIEIGGELKVKGFKNMEKWTIAIESPHPINLAKGYQKILKIKDMAVATSGDYKNYFLEKKRKYSHTIDRRTGAPVVSNLVSVTVLDKLSCMKADAWATAMMALGAKKGLELAKKLHLPVYFIYKEGDKFLESKTLEFSRIEDGY